MTEDDGFITIYEFASSKNPLYHIVTRPHMIRTLTHAEMDALIQKANQNAREEIADEVLRERFGVGIYELDEKRVAAGMSALMQAAADYTHEPELTATQLVLRERIAAQSKAHAEDVLRGLAKFMAANPGARPVLETWYDDDTQTIHSEWTAGDPT